jgi:hypothetical protein
MLPLQQSRWRRSALYRRRTHDAMSKTRNSAIAVIGIDVAKNSFHVVGHDEHGAIVLRQKWSRGQVEGTICQLATVPEGFGRAGNQPRNPLLNRRERTDARTKFGFANASPERRIVMLKSLERQRQMCSG